MHLVNFRLHLHINIFALFFFIFLSNELNTEKAKTSKQIMFLTTIELELYASIGGAVIIRMNNKFAH